MQPKAEICRNGGFTVANYGSHRKVGIDAVLFEFPTVFRRDKDEIEDWAKRAAKSIVSFQETYLKLPAGSKK